MVKVTFIRTYVIMTLETTDLPKLDGNSTKITAIRLIAVSRKDIQKTKLGDLPEEYEELFSLINPEKEISEDAEEISGITQDMVKNEPTFKDKFEDICTFLDDLDKPVCLVAHNGNRFHYKILRAECLEADVSLPDDLLCVDSWRGFLDLCKTKRERVKPLRLPLNALYERLFKGIECHDIVETDNKAELLLLCLVAAETRKRRVKFLEWADKKCKPLKKIKPLV